jgi:hypothetical protein
MRDNYISFPAFYHTLKINEKNLSHIFFHNLLKECPILAKHALGKSNQTKNYNYYLIIQKILISVA